MSAKKIGFEIIKTNTGKRFYSKTENQDKLVNSIVKNQMTFCTGPAGTGKTFMSILMASKYLKEGKIEKIIITRPMVTAGEDMGFLPGEISNKMDPFLRPIFDVLDMIHQKPKTKNKGKKTTQETSVEYSDQVEMIPLAFMRGRTFNNAFVICDESQNTNVEQMRMLVTRIGYGSKLVISGDTLQTDIRKQNGLEHFIGRLENNKIDEIDVVKFTKQDIVRNPLINQIEEKIYNN